MEPEEEVKPDDAKKTAALIGGSVVLALICLIGFGSPDGNKLDHEFREDLKYGTQMKDVIAYLKEHGWTYEWNKDLKSITTVVPGAPWLPVIKPRFKKIFYFDNFNRLKSQNGNIEYGM